MSEKYSMCGRCGCFADDNCPDDDCARCGASLEKDLECICTRLNFNPIDVLEFDTSALQAEGHKISTPGCPIHGARGTERSY